MTIIDRFCSYVRIDTTADPDSTSFPSSEKQKNLAKVLFRELQEMGLEKVELDEHGYVIATIPGNSLNPEVPTILLCSHMDTAPDCSGTDVKPIVHHNYDGAPIVLPDDTSQVIRVDDHPYLKEKIGDDIITASGLTLLGADNKAGVSIIMDFAQKLISNNTIKHGPIQILFTPDEEVGRGVDFLDMKKIQASFGYTLDGGPLGDIEDETFSADGITVEINGVSAHPGYAKGKMVNAIKVASEIIDHLPKDTWSPETTDNRDGFVHPVSISGGLEKATLNFISRDHNTSLLEAHGQRLESIVQKVTKKHPGATYAFSQEEQYRNMKDVLVNYPFVTNYVEQAMNNIGISPRRAIIRGGTDGCRLSYMGVPCPNIFTGEMAIHSRHEYVSVQDMEKAVSTLWELVQIWEKHEA